MPQGSRRRIRPNSIVSPFTGSTDATNGVTSKSTPARDRDVWDHAVDRTLHGDPVELRPKDFLPTR